MRSRRIADEERVYILVAFCLLYVPFYIQLIIKHYYNVFGATNYTLTIPSKSFTFL